MAAALRDATEFLANPTPANQAKLAQQSSKLTAAGQQITEYFTSQCG